MLRTVNGGNTWDIIYNDMYAPRKLEFVNNTLYGFGRGIWKSNNGGNTWQMLNNAPPALFNSFSYFSGTFKNAFNGIAVGTNGNIYRNQIIDSVSWSPARGLSNTQIVNPWASPTETEVYTALVKMGNCFASEYKTVIVNPLKISGSKRLIKYCGDTLTIQAGINSQLAHLYHFKWLPTNTIVGSDSSLTIKTTMDTAMYFYLTVNSVNGCSVSDTFKMVRELEFNLPSLYTVNCGNSIMPMVDTTVWIAYNHESALNFSAVQFVSKDTVFVLGEKLFLGQIMAANHGLQTLFQPCMMW